MPICTERRQVSPDRGDLGLCKTLWSVGYVITQVAITELRVGDSRRVVVRTLILLRSEKGSMSVFHQVFIPPCLSPPPPHQTSP